MLFRAVIVSLGYLWLDLRILFASNSLKLCFKLFFFTGVSNYCEERKKKTAILKINFYIKISKNLGGNFSNLGSKCLDVWQFFRKHFGIPESKFSAFYEHNRDSLTLRAVVSPGRTLRYEGRETTASNHRACASTWHHFLLFARNISKTTTLHVLHNFLFISFRFYTTTTQKNASFCFFFMLNLKQARRNFILFRVWIWSLGIQLQVLFAHIWQS